MFMDMAVSTGLVLELGAAFFIGIAVVIAAVVLIIRAVIRKKRRDRE